MSVLQPPEASMYWSKDWLFGNHFITHFMTRDRYDKISQYLHASDSTKFTTRQDPNHDRLQHVREIHDIVLKKCKDRYNPHENQSIDEAMIAFRGRLSFRQYLPAKPTKYGIKVWSRADPSDGYLHQFQIYTGRVGRAGGREQGLSTRVVLDLVKDIKGKFHTINADNFFSSPRLAEQLLQKDTYYWGTAHVNRLRVPHRLLDAALGSVKEQGQSAILQHGTSSMAVTFWKDKKVINFLSTADDTTETASVSRHQRNGTA